MEGLAKSRRAHRLLALPHDVLAELLATSCETDLALCARADALLQQEKPLPGWCTDILLSPDLLPHLLELLELCDARVASVCSAWAAGWAALLRARRYVDPKPLRVFPLPETPHGMAVLPNGDICIGGAEDMRFISPQGEVAGEAWQGFVQAGLKRDYPFLDSANTLLVIDLHNQAVVRQRLSDGAVLARSPVLVHDEYSALSGGMASANDKLYVMEEYKVHVLNSQTLQPCFHFGRFSCASDCAIRGDELYVATATRGELPIFDLAGRTLRRTLRGAFGKPRRIQIYHDLIYMLECCDRRSDNPVIHEWACRRLLVLRLDGTLRQEIRLGSSLLEMQLHGGELFVGGSQVEGAGPGAPVQGVCHVFRVA